MTNLSVPTWLITGRAATGKSTLRKIAIQEAAKACINIVNFCDEEEMLKIINEDQNHEHHYHPHEDEKFLFRDCYPFDEGIRRISKNVEAIYDDNSKRPVIVIIELARGAVNKVMDFSFRRLFELTSQRVIENSTFFYVKSASNDQLERNRQREKDGMPHPPETIMRELYLQDDFEWARQRYPFTVIENSGDYTSFIDKCASEIRARIESVLSSQDE